MNITVPVSVGEVIDKVTILEIKSERISDEAKLKNVATELEALRPLVSGGVFDSDELVELTDGLRRVNAELWDIEDDIRAEEAAGHFGDRFIELARAVYITNDRRADLKKKINLATGSDLIEEKAYEDYTGTGGASGAAVLRGPRSPTAASTSSLDMVPRSPGCSGVTGFVTDL